jgi:hypothetical protein
MPITPKSWAETFAAELTVDGEHIPLERVIARHLDALKEFRRLGMTWSGIARLLVRAGARRADGKLISAAQIRVSYTRLSLPRSESRPAATRLRTVPKIEAPSLIAPPSDPAAAPAAAPPPPLAPPSDRGDIAGGDTKEVSDSELQSALMRLDKLSTKGPKK